MKIVVVQLFHLGRSNGQVNDQVIFRNELLTGKLRRGVYFRSQLWKNLHCIPEDFVKMQILFQQVCDAFPNKTKCSHVMLMLLV